MSDVIKPRVFISYSWSSPAHEAWVLKLAEDLVEVGVHPVIDRWDLREGDDAAAFMERMVNDPEIKKVILVCDRRYKEKADARVGGAGTEAQIISPELYGRSVNTKFCAVLAEKGEDGQGVVPTYYRGRIHIDLSEDYERVERFEQLVRWIYEKPLHERPKIGKRPAFLDENSSDLQLQTAVASRRALDAIRNHKPYWQSALLEYLDAFSDGLEQLRLPKVQDYERVVQVSLTSFLPYRDQLINVFKACAAQDLEQEVASIFHRFFEGLLRYLGPPPTVFSWSECEDDNYKFIIYELFIHVIAESVNRERFVLLYSLLQQDYFGRASRLDFHQGMQPFTIFGAYRSTVFKLLNEQEKPRKESYRAHLLNLRCVESGYSFRNLMQADLLMALAAGSRNEDEARWWPDTLLYASQQGVFPIFARCQSRAYLGKVETALAPAPGKLAEVIAAVDRTGGLFAAIGMPITMRTLTGIDKWCSRG